MLVHLRKLDGRGVDQVAGLHHGVGQDGGLLGRHSADEDRHGHGGHLVVRDVVTGIPVNERANLLLGEDPAVAFLLDDPLR